MEDPNVQPVADPAVEGQVDANAPAAETKPEEVPPEPKKEVIPEEVMESMKQLWNVFAKRSADKNPDKTAELTDKIVDIKFLRMIMRSLDFDLNEKELELCSGQIDPKKEGIITWKNLNLVMEDRLKEVDTYEDLIEEFKKLDKDDDGKIPAPEYRQYMKNLGVKLSEEAVEEMMEEADGKGEGVVNMEEFAQKICPAKD